MQGMTELFLNRLSLILNRLFARNYLRPYEQLVLDEWRKTLSSENQRVLDSQLQAVDFIQRQAGDAKVCFFYREGKSIPLFPNNKPDLKAATITLRSAVGPKDQTLRVKIFVHRGRFFSIEFPKRPNRYFHLHHMKADELVFEAVEKNSVLD
jgi:hypothetical protein